MPFPTRGTLFHCPAHPTVGDAIIPLNAQREVAPELYRRNIAKYASMPHVVQTFIEPLECTWGDVVFISPVHPAPLFDALKRAGRRARSSPPWTLPAERLDPTTTVILLMRAGSQGHHADPPTPDDYLPFSTASLRAISRITVDAIARLESIGDHDPWLPWVDVPHVLHRGKIPFAWFTRP